MATKASIERAAQAWCDPTTGHLVMEPALAYVFADLLDEEKKKYQAVLEDVTGWLAAVLDQVDYEDRACGLMEPVGAVLESRLLGNARDAARDALRFLTSESAGDV